MNPLFGALAATSPHPLWILPFVAMLLAIALLPALHEKWWEHHHPKIAACLGGFTIAYYIFVRHEGMRMSHVAHEYASFMALIGSLFIVSGGIHITPKGEAKPWVNSIFLLTGAILANIIGTTGASMLLIRPWMRMNQSRIAAFHIVFFIFIVSNIGGCLSPIGDPPLFLGYLKGVPFWWVLQKCWMAWVVVIGLLLAVFFWLDSGNYRKRLSSIHRTEIPEQTWRIEGWRNLLFLIVILAAVFLRHPAGLSEALMVVAAAGSWIATPQRIHERNDFDLRPIREVAWLFAGIFITMIPALDLLETHAVSLGLISSSGFFWLTGSLSACLDNAPTYLAFLATSLGQQNLSVNDPSQMHDFVAAHPRDLMAISLGAVFFGAMTYIGNGPNFIIRAIAGRQGIKVPGFFSFTLKYACPILLPIFLLISYLFF